MTTPAQTSGPFYPLTLPLTVGPGSISVASRWEEIPRAACAPCYADAILRRLGTTGAAVLTRLSAFILLAIGVQIAWNGIRALLATLPNAA